MSSIPTIFLLSPAHCAGKRAGYLLRDEPKSSLGERFQREGASIGEVFSFVSGLYFRGKVAYSGAFSRPPSGENGALVITACDGLLPAEASIKPADLRRYADANIAVGNPEYETPLLDDLRRVADRLGEKGRAVLLGSIATDKYVDVLLPILGDRLRFPEVFVGCGDMRRGALMLRAAESGAEFDYVRADSAQRSTAAGRQDR